jgi:hypothetical protein
MLQRKGDSRCSSVKRACQERAAERNFSCAAVFCETFDLTPQTRARADFSARGRHGWRAADRQGRTGSE